MMVAALSVCMVTYKATVSNYVIQTADSQDFISSNVPCTLNLKKRGLRDRNCGFSTRSKGGLSSTFIVFAIRNEKKEPERGGTNACTDDQSLKKYGSSKYQRDEVTTSLLHLEDPSMNAEFVGNQGDLLDKLKAVHLHVLAMEKWNSSPLKLCHRSYSVSAANLIHYLAMKSLNVETLQEDLSSIGLLNLDTINPYVLASLSAGIQMLENIKSNPLNTNTTINNQEFTRNRMTKRASSNRELLLGQVQDGRSSHIMVTVGQEAIESETLILDLLKKGTTVFRINCAHGNPSVWSEIITRVKSGSQMLEKPCRVLMDLAGPKLRTDKMKDGPRVKKLSPKKSANGNTMFPAQVWLSPRGAGPPPAHLSPDVVLYVDGQKFLSRLEVGDDVRFSDARGKQRMLKISKKFPIFSGVGFLTECTDTAYVQSGTELYVKGSKKKSSLGFVVDVPPVEQFVKVRVGDLLSITRDGSNCSTIGNTHRITCSSGYLFDSVKPGQPIAFDDGKIWGIIKGTSSSEIIVSITHAGPKGTKLGSEKSINIPESEIRFEGLTSKDVMDLDFVASHADMVGVSFVRDVRDIVVLYQEIKKRKMKNLGIVLKIETRGGFTNLPLMLVEAMKCPNPLGVMVARGDLAVECGWEFLAAIQEEIISICSAAHIPVIWATQVLESLVKSGVPSRAEITDVANGRRASCIMLNKGEHIVEAVSTLDAILKSSSTKVREELQALALSSHLI